MKCLAAILSTICLLNFTTAYAQEPDRIQRDRFVQVPREVVLPVVVFQPASPMQFERVERLLGTSGGGANIYRLRNTGPTPIRRYTISYIFAQGTGGSWEWAGASGELILPGQLAPSSSGDIIDRIVPLTDTLRDKLKLRLPMKTVVFYLVERVEFVDGSVYTDELACNALKAYLDDMAEKVYQSERPQLRKSSRNNDAIITTEPG